MNMNTNSPISPTMNSINQKAQKDQILEILIQASKNVNTDEHQKTIFELLLFESNELAYSELLLAILSDFQEIIIAYPNISDQLSILIYIKNFLQHVHQRKEISLFPNIEFTVQKCLSIFFIDSLNKETKAIYDEIIQSLLNIAHNFKAPIPFFNNLFNSIIEQFNDQLFIPLKIKDYLLFLNKVIQHFLLFDFNFSESIRFIQVFNVIYERISLINQSANDHTQKMELTTVFILYFSQVCSNCFDSFNKHIISIYNIDKAQKEILSNAFFETDGFISLIKRCLTANSDNVVIDYNIDSGQFNTSLIKSKGMIIELLSIICEKLYKMNLITQYPKFQDMITTLLQGLIAQMVALYKMKDYPREKADNTNEEISQLMNIVRILLFFAEVNETIYGNELFTHHSKEIFQFIILPNLLPSPLELSLFTFDQEEYLRHSLDMASHCSERLPKKKALKLLISMCYNSPKMLKAIIDLYLDIIDSITGIKQDNDKLSDCELYSALINNIPQEHLLEQAMQVFTSLSSLFLDYNELLNKLEERIDNINHILIKISNDYLKTKLCFFYKYNLAYLFNDTQQVVSKSFDDSIIFIFNCIMSPSMNKSLILSALNAINYIIFNKKLIKFCGQLVKIYSNQIVTFFRSNKELKDIIRSEEYDAFIKGIIKHYLIKLEKEAIAIFKYFWDEFNVSLTNSINQGKKKIPFQDRNSQVILVKNIHFLKQFTHIAKSNNKEIIQEIYTPILYLLNKLSDFLNWDFENDILELISSLIEEINFVPFDYAIALKKYFEVLNSGYDGVFEHKFEEYHIQFVFTFIKHMNVAQIEELKYKDLLKELLNDHLMSIPRKIKVGSIYTEHYIYCDLGSVYIMMFWNYFSKEDIMKLIKLFNKRMNTLPNADLTLNLKLAMNIFLLINCASDYEVLKDFNYRLFIIKIMQFFPIDDCSIIEHEQVARFCSSIVRWIIIQLSSVIETSNENEKLIASMINLNYEELKLIKKKTQSELKKKNTAIAKSEFKKEEFSCGKFTYGPRSTKEIKLDSDDSFAFSDNDDDNDADNDNEDNDGYNDRNGDYRGNDSDKAVNDEDEDDNISNALNENQFKFDYTPKLDLEDKDHNFISLKKTINQFDDYYKKYCNEVIVIQSTQINVFMLFDLMLSDLESNASMMYDKIIQSYNEKQMYLINDFRKYKKISVDGLFVYRKIMQMKPNSSNSNTNNKTNTNNSIQK